MKTIIKQASDLSEVFRVNWNNMVYIYDFIWIDQVPCSNCVYVGIQPIREILSNDNYLFIYKCLFGYKLSIVDRMLCLVGEL